MSQSTDRFERQIVVAAARARVWHALTDVREFNEWFGVALTSPFAPGAVVSGHITTEGYEDNVATLWVETMEPERRFSFRWHPYAIGPASEYEREPTTLVTFTLEDAAGGTRLTVVESGFDAIPESRRATAFSMNEQGWTVQLQQVKRWAEGS